MGLFSWLHSRRAAQEAIRSVQTGRLNEAVSAIEGILSDKPNDWELWCTLGECRASLGDLNGAETAFLRCLELYPESVEAKEGLALVYADGRREWQQALALLEEIVPATEEAGLTEFSHLSMAWVYYLAGDKAKATEHFALAAPAWDKPDLQEVEDAQFAANEYHLGVLHSELGADVTRALSHLRRAAQLSPASVYAKHAREMIAKLSGAG